MLSFLWKLNISKYHNVLSRHGVQNIDGFYRLTRTDIDSIELMMYLFDTVNNTDAILYHARMIVHGVNNPSDINLFNDSDFNELNIKPFHRMKLQIDPDGHVFKLKEILIKKPKPKPKPICVSTIQWKFAVFVPPKKPSGVRI